MNMPDGKRWMRNRPELLAMVVRFNTLVPPSIHPARAPAWMQQEAVKKVSATPRGQRRLSEALRRWVKLNSSGYYDFQPLHRRFALLEFSTLDRLLAFTGAALLSPWLTRIVRRDELCAARQALGMELFSFATKRARFLATDGLATTSPNAMTMEAVRRSGWTQLENCLAGESPELVRRFQLKLPLELNLEVADGPGSMVKERIATLMRKILISEIEPELAICFE